MISFEGRVLLMSGAAGGIGLATARVFARAGASLALGDLDERRLEEACATLDLPADRLLLATHDVTDPESSRDLVRQVQEKFGGVDVVVPNAGLYPTDTFAGMSATSWSRTLAVNLDGVFHLCQAALPALRPEASMVLVASMAAHYGSPTHAHYAAAKGGVLSLARSLAKELAPVRVNAISPGLIDTPMVRPLMQARGPELLNATPLRRLGTPEEVANCIAFLASPLASYVTGATLHANGGLYIA
ncbi:SDR family NAD(P)-dependent oxidoreductase [Oceanibaculum indicum]|uniref:3-oxoacyl-[acyl-carrier protein] reductase n=1 Tax=Oceanibaculum indicum TaxID=526216 RepID=A0A420WSC6_9PROT|nr:SDR family NAD(P)-dependent oxidoreductase [Oceanibaculum indicum]RKQ73890.1 3-oxoacyl-[acyl-carrier protein] reductase [Oceanibaculum indicum]